MFICPSRCSSGRASPSLLMMIGNLGVNYLELQKSMMPKSKWRIILATLGLSFSLVLVAAPLAASADSVTKGLDDLRSKTANSYPTNLPGGRDATVAGTLATVINYALGIGFAVAVVMVIYGGYQYIFSAGSEEKATSGRNTILYALIGMVIIIFSFVIVNTIVKYAKNGDSAAPNGNSNSTII